MILRAAAGMQTSGRFLKRTLRRTRAGRRRPVENRVALGGGFLGWGRCNARRPVTPCHGGIARSGAYHPAQEQLRDHQFTEDARMSDVPRAFRHDADGEPFLWPVRWLASPPANAAPEYAAQRERQYAAIGEARATLEHVDAARRSQPRGCKATASRSSNQCEQRLVVRRGIPPKLR